MLCIIFFEGTDLADYLRKTIDRISEIDPKSAFIPGTSDWEANVLFSIYMQMVTAVRFDPNDFRTVLELSHLDSNNGTVVKAAMNAFKHFGPSLYTSQAALERAISCRIDKILGFSGDRLQ